MPAVPPPLPRGGEHCRHRPQPLHHPTTLQHQAGGDGCGHRDSAGPREPREGMMERRLRAEKPFPQLCGPPSSRSGAQCLPGCSPAAGVRGGHSITPHAGGCWRQAGSIPGWAETREAGDPSAPQCCPSLACPCLGSRCSGEQQPSTSHSPRELHFLPPGPPSPAYPLLTPRPISISGRFK